jgi:hypothetical protein
MPRGTTPGYRADARTSRGRVGCAPAARQSNVAQRGRLRTGTSSRGCQGSRWSGVRRDGPVDQRRGVGHLSHKAGIRATTLTPRDKGIGYLAGVADDPVVVRSYYLDRVAADRIADRAQAMRERAGTLTGYCVAEDDGPRPVRNARSAPLWLRDNP